MARLADVDALINDVMERYCKDCERRKGIKNGRRKVIYDIGDAPCRSCAVDDMIDALDNAPTVDPVKHGEWRYDEALELEWCSECGFGKRKGDKRWYSYCPHCGAKMDEVEE